jgi:hypothetical protein
MYAARTIHHMTFHAIFRMGSRWQGRFSLHAVDVAGEAVSSIARVVEGEEITESRPITRMAENTLSGISRRHLARFRVTVMTLDTGIR